MTQVAKHSKGYSKLVFESELLSLVVKNKPSTFPFDNTNSDYVNLFTYLKHYIDNCKFLECELGLPNPRLQNGSVNR